jgi:hypothetical protein
MRQVAGEPESQLFVREAVLRQTGTWQGAAHIPPLALDAIPEVLEIVGSAS